MLSKEPAPATDAVIDGGAAAAFLAAGIGAFAMGLIAFLGAIDVISSPALYKPAGGVTGRTTVAAILWLAAWGVLHRRWRGRQLPPPRIYRRTLGLIVAGVVLAFPPLWNVFE